MNSAGGGEQGGCRSFLAAGCLVALAALSLAAVTVLLALFAALWLIRFAWSLF